MMKDQFANYVVQKVSTHAWRMSSLTSRSTVIRERIDALDRDEAILSAEMIEFCCRMRETGWKNSKSNPVLPSILLILR